MEFEVFGQLSRMRDWHHDAASDVTYPAHVHWSEVQEAGEADLKLIWEPSRFGWAIDLARAHLTLADVDAAGVFWRSFESWREQNPPNAGVNWFCGQEASVRLMSVLLAAQAMQDTVDEQRARWIQELALATGERVESNIGYARSQRNNHHVSEAVGLVTAAYVMGPGVDGDRWWALGERHLLEVVDKLIFADGGSSQYSTNYHRVFVHNLTWAVLVYRAAGREAPARVVDALRRATIFLAALVDQRSGSGWFFGADDGSKVLALSAGPHRRLKEDVHLASAVAEIECACGCALVATDGEVLSWFGLAAPATAQRPSDPEIRSFPEAGVYVLSCAETSAFIRCGSYAYRPSQDDQLHCDVWINGCNIVKDSGTGSYKQTARGLAMFDEVWDHNSPHLADIPYSPKVSRFLRARWTAGKAVHLGCDATTANGVFAVETNRHTFTRSVQVANGVVTVTDRFDDDEDFLVRWKSANTIPSVSSASGSTAEVRRLRSTYSRGYGSSDGIEVTEVTGRGEVRSTWSVGSP